MHENFLDSIHKATSLEFAKQLIFDVDDFEAILREQEAKSEDKLTDDECGLFSAIRIAAFLNANLVLVAKERNNEGLQIFWDEFRDEKPCPFLVLESVASNSSNLSYSITRELRGGNDLAAKQLNRGFAELTECLAAIIYDKQLYQTYVDEPDDTSKFYGHWKNNLTPYKVRKSLKKCVEDSTTWGQHWADWMKGFQDFSYGYQSNFTHVSFATQYVAASPLGSHWMGSYSEMMNTTMRHHIVSTMCYHGSLLDALFSIHGWELGIHETTDNYFKAASAFFQLIEDNRPLFFNMEESKMVDV